MHANLVILLLSLSIGLQPVSTDLYLPGLPSMALDLQASVGMVQYTLSGLLLAFGISQLFWGPFSDKVGRRPIMLTGLVVYAVAADASIIRIFLAGFLPGFLLMALFCGYIMWWSVRNPDQVPAADPPTTFMEKIRLSRNLIPCGALIVFVCWVLITGYATATECAAYGVVGALALAAWGGSLTWANFWEGLMGTTRSSCMIMFILAGAAFLTKTMAFTGIPRELAEWVNAMQLSPMALIAVLTVVYLILGTALDGISMIVLTSAVVLPMIQKAGFDLIWFGIFIVLLVEIAEVTPPVGFNLFVLQNMTGKDSNTIARAALPFFACLVVCIVLITVFPQIVTYLPDVVMGFDK